MNSAAPATYSLDTLVTGLNLKLSKCSAVSTVIAANDTHLIDASTALEGSRNNTLTSSAGFMRYSGKDEIEILAELRKMNDQLCLPPLDDDEVRKIAQSVCRYPKNQERAILLSLHDAGNAKRLVCQFGADIRYVPEWGKWLFWSNNRWTLDEQGHLTEFAKQTAASIQNEVSAEQSKDSRRAISQHAKQSQNAARITRMIELAKSDPRVVLRAKNIDARPMLLGVENGVIELDKKKHREVDRSDYLSAIAPVAYDQTAICPRFLQFLNEVTGGDNELQKYLQRVVGYCLTGETNEQVFFFFYGAGANGKSSFLNILRALMGGQLAKQTPSSTLMSHYGARTTTNDLARLQNSRVAIASEVEEGSFFDEPMIKGMSGGDLISCRYLYQEHFEYLPQFKILIAGNHKPVIKGGDEGIWRRLHLIPFTVTIPYDKRDKHLQQKLESELPGILNWALQGTSLWMQHGLNPPKIITDATNEYRTEMDLIGQWISDRCTLNPALSCSGKDLYFNYQGWCISCGLKSLSRNAWSKKLALKKIVPTRTMNGVEYTGIAIA